MQGKIKMYYMYYSLKTLQHCVVLFSGPLKSGMVCCLDFKIGFCSRARGCQWCGIFHDYWRTGSIKPRPLFSPCKLCFLSFLRASLFQNNTPRMTRSECYFVRTHGYIPRYLRKTTNVLLVAIISPVTSLSKRFPTCSCVLFAKLGTIPADILISVFTK